MKRHRLSRVQMLSVQLVIAMVLSIDYAHRTGRTCEYYLSVGKAKIPSCIRLPCITTSARPVGFTFKVCWYLVPAAIGCIWRAHIRVKGSTAESYKGGHDTRWLVKEQMVNSKARRARSTSAAAGAH